LQENNLIRYQKIQGIKLKRRYSINDPEKSKILDTKKLKGVRGGEDLFRLRIGNYRVVYFEDVDSFKIIQIFHRGKGYKWL